MIPSKVVPVNAVQSDNDNTDGKGESNLEKKQHNVEGDQSHNQNDIKTIDKPTVTERVSKKYKKKKKIKKMPK